jgi:hypothetical protein
MIEKRLFQLLALSAAVLSAPLLAQTTEVTHHRGKNYSAYSLHKNGTWAKSDIHVNRHGYSHSYNLDSHGNTSQTFTSRNGYSVTLGDAPAPVAIPVPVTAESEPMPEYSTWPEDNIDSQPQAFHNFDTGAGQPLPPPAY